METICTNAIEAAGGPAALATKLVELTGRPITSQAISQWKVIPPGRVVAVEQITGISRHALRPDVFGAEPVAAPKHSKAKQVSA